MDKTDQLKRQLIKVINVLEKDYSNEIKKDILQLIYKRYKNALKIIENNQSIDQVNISGGVRAYMDSYNDYQNPLLEQLHKAEKLLKELI